MRMSLDVVLGEDISVFVDEVESGFDVFMEVSIAE